MTDKPRLSEYFAPIGKLTIAAARLEEVTLIWIAQLAEDEPKAVRNQEILTGLKTKLRKLKGRVTSLVMGARQQTIVDLIDEADSLREKRNECVHAVWSEFQNARSGEFVEVARSRFFRSGSSLSWDVSVPTIEELENDAKRLNEVAGQLHNQLELAWINSDSVTEWRYSKNR